MVKKTYSTCIYACAASGRTCSTKLPPEQVVEHSDQGRWFQEKPTSLSPLPVRWMGTLNLYRIPWFCSWRRTWGTQKLWGQKEEPGENTTVGGFLYVSQYFLCKSLLLVHLSLRNCLFSATLKLKMVTFLCSLDTAHEGAETEEKQPGCRS